MSPSLLVRALGFPSVRRRRRHTTLGWPVGPLLKYYAPAIVLASHNRHRHRPCPSLSEASVSPASRSGLSVAQTSAAYTADPADNNPSFYKNRACVKCIILDWRPAAVDVHQGRWEGWREEWQRQRRHRRRAVRELCRWQRCQGRARAHRAWLFKERQQHAPRATTIALTVGPDVATRQRLAMHPVLLVRVIALEHVAPLVQAKVFVRRVRGRW